MGGLIVWVSHGCVLIANSFTDDPFDRFFEFLFVKPVMSSAHRDSVKFDLVKAERLL